jgi:hypothetical protein
MPQNTPIYLSIGCRPSTRVHLQHSESNIHLIAEELKLAEEVAREMEEELAEELTKKLELDEKLAHELARKLELEDSLPESQDADLSQLQIIREVAEREEMENVLLEATTGLDAGLESDFLAAPNAPGTTAPPHVDYVLSQQQAMGEWQQITRSPIRRHQVCRGQREASYQASFKYYTPHSSDGSEALPNPNEDPLLQEGNMEMKEANACVCRPFWRKTVERLVVAPFKRDRSRVETSP